jgi:hypothetical protein
LRETLSLVVAEVTDEGPRIVCDTRVVFPDGQRSRFRTGALKAIVIARDMTISFAGDVVAGLGGVREFARRRAQGHPLIELLLMLRERTSDDRRAAEFLVATGGVGGELIRIRSGTTERSLPVAWIGDQGGFERFQRERSRPLDADDVALEAGLPPAVKTMRTLRRAMRAAIDDPAIPSVADFCVPVAYRPSGFYYLSSTFIYVGRDFAIKGGDDLISKMAQPVSEGGYDVSVVAPAEPGTPALGLSFARARLGMLYLPLQFDGAEVISDLSPNDFARVVFERFGVRMQNPGLLEARGGP